MNDVDIARDELEVLTPVVIDHSDQDVQGLAMGSSSSSGGHCSSGSGG
jgi:hypothetical protein